MKFIAEADCWTTRGRYCTWGPTTITADDHPAAIRQADRTLAKAGYNRVKLRVRAAEQETHGG